MSAYGVVADGVVAHGSHPQPGARQVDNSGLHAMTTCPQVTSTTCTHALLSLHYVHHHVSSLHWQMAFLHQGCQRGRHLYLAALSAYLTPHHDDIIQA